jgi:hypothetical protein
MFLQQSQQRQQETPEQREQRLALLDPIDRMREEMRESRSASERQMQLMQIGMADQSDKATFDAKALVDTLYQKWQPRVEAFVSEHRAKGQLFGREQALAYLIGKNALDTRGSQGSKQRQQAERRVARQQTRPGNSRSDVAAAERRGGSEGDRRERRLENVQL